jgi:SAM-dependent methyltransferase
MIAGRNGLRRLPAVNDYLKVNQEAWATWAPEYLERGRRNWAGEPDWGLWGIPESEVGMLPDGDGLDVLELGCGTAYVSAWIARRGGRPIGVDPTVEQLGSARLLQDEFDLHFPLVRGAGEHVPFADESFDCVISEYGAAIWADPYQWIPEAARVLRPGGRLTFMCNGVILMLCSPEKEDEVVVEQLLRPYFGMHRFEWPDDPAIDFHLNHGDMIRLLRANGFEIEDLVELRPADGATTNYPWVTLEWAQQWPSEEVWKAVKKA